MVGVVGGVSGLCASDCMTIRCVGRGRGEERRSREKGERGGRREMRREGGREG